MPGTIEHTSEPLDLGRAADLVVAALYDEEAEPPWAILPNVAPLSVQWFEGPQPPVARFRYVFSPALIGEQFPSRIEEAFPLDLPPSPYILQSDDRVGVFRYTSAGRVEILFDGFALSPQADLSPSGEMVTITAIGVPHRESDVAIGGALVRSSAAPDKPDEDQATGLPCRFNPEGFPNASPDDKDNPGEHNFDSHIDDPRDGHDGEEIKFPTFLGPYPPGDKVADLDLRMWSVEDAVTYLLAQMNPKMKFVQWDRDGLRVLVARVPYPKTSTTIDVDDPDTYEEAAIDVDDVDCTGMTWPDAVHRMVLPHGFNFRWELAIDEDLVPTWYVVFYRLDDTDGKDLWLQAYGSGPLDPARSNTQSLSLSRDSHALVNRVVVDMRPTLVEASYVLAPGFDIDAGDAANLSQFDLGDENCTGDNLDKYRLFVLDEAGEGHWLLKSGTHLDAGKPAQADLDDVLNTESVYGEDPPSDGVVAVRRRKPISPVITPDDKTHEPLRAKLHVSFDYGRTAPGTWDQESDLPGVWDGDSGTWDEVQSSEWELLDDRIGVRFTCKDANEVHIGKRDNWKSYPAAFSNVTWPARQNGVLPLVELLTTADGANGFNVPVFLLTCVVSADTSPKAVANGIVASPTGFKIERRYDARHRFHKHVVSKYSILADDDHRGEKDDVVEDDTDAARAMASAMLRAHQFARFAGSVVIPRLTSAYRVGDRVRGIEGRDIDFNQSAGTEGGSSPVYPTVASVEWTFESEQRTVLHLSDRRVEAPPQRQKRNKPGFNKA